MKRLIIATALAFTTLVSSSMTTPTPNNPVAKLSEAELKAAYWKCDLASMTGMLDAGEAAACSTVYERLLITLNPVGTNHERYASFMTWWRANKDVEHAKLKATPRQ